MPLCFVVLWLWRELRWLSLCRPPPPPPKKKWTKGKVRVCWFTTHGKRKIIFASISEKRIAQKLFFSAPALLPNILPQENMRGQRGTLPVIALWYVIVAKVIYRLAHKRKCVFRDVALRLRLVSVNSGERLGIGKFCRWKRLPKRKKVVYLEQELAVWRMLNSSFRYKRLAGGHIRFWRRYSAGSGKRFGWYFFARW